MLILSIINLFFILLLDSIRIQDMIVAYNESDFNKLFGILAFILTINILALLCVFKYNKVYVKYIYPIELLLYILFLSFYDIKYSRNIIRFNESSQNINQNTTTPINPCNRELIDNIIIDIEDQKYHIKGKIKVIVNLTFDGTNNIHIKNISAKWIGLTTYNLPSHNCIFLYNWSLTKNVHIFIEPIIIKTLVTSINKNDSSNFLKIPCLITVPYFIRVNFISKTVEYNNTVDFKSLITIPLQLDKKI